MPRKTKAQTLAEIHQEALLEFDRVAAVMIPEREQCREDRRAYTIPGALWEDKFGQQFANKPRLDVNKGNLAVTRIISEYRNNRIGVSFVPKAGHDADSLADTCAGLFRADEADSNAEEAYDNGFEEAVGGGFGALLVDHQYEDEYDEDGDEQRIRILPIYDADTTVFFDLGAKRQDKSDAKKCWHLVAMDRHAYVEQYNDDPASWPNDLELSSFDWSAPDIVYVADYYRAEEARQEVQWWESVTGEEVKFTEDDFLDEEGLAEKLEAAGWTRVRAKKVKRRRIHKYIMSGGGVLEDCGYIAGDCIPVIPIYGKRWYIDNIERCAGHIRYTKDAARVKNMQVSKLAEIAALSSVEKPILTPQQIAGHSVLWSEDNVEDYPYLLLNPVTDASGNEVATGPVGYTKPPQVPPAMAALLQQTEYDLKELLGSQDQGDKMVSNISGKAVEMIQQRLDMQAYIYISNFAKAIRRVGEVWLGMAKELYGEPGRQMKYIGEDSEAETVTLKEPRSNNGQTVYANDLSRAKMDVTVDVGPSSTSRRDAMQRSMLNLLAVTEDPESKQVITATLLMNSEGEGMGDFRDYWRKKLVGMGVIPPTDEERQAMEAAASGEDPAAKLMAAAASEAEAKATKARADVVETVADAEYKRAQAEKVKAETAKILMGG